MISRLFTSFVTMIATIFFIQSASAATLLRDADIERGLREIARPVLNAAGLNANQIRILIVNDSSLNAFVIDNKTIFIHSGLLLKLKSPAQLQGIIAHETAHIANGHINRRISQFRKAQRNSIYGMLLAAAVAAAGEGKAAGGILAGSQGATQRAILAHSRSEEASADQSAIRYLERSKISASGLAEVFEIFNGQEALSAGRQDPYVRSHPLSRDRVRVIRSTAISEFVEKQSDRYWFERLHGKLSAFTRAPRWTQRRATGDTDIDLMRRAVAHFKATQSDKAISTMKTLVNRRPNDPYFRELLGQIELESRRFQAAVGSYQKAVQLAPRDPLILSGLGRALLTLKTKSGDQQALKALRKAYANDQKNGRMLRNLSVAYARLGQPGQASLITAERYMLRGDPKNAKIQAERAVKRLPEGSAAWRKAQDILAQVNR